MESNDFKSGNMMHSIKSMENWDLDCNDEMDIKKEKKQDKDQDKNKKQDKSCDKKYDKDYDKKCDKDYDKKYDKDYDKKYDKDYDKKYDKDYDKKYDKDYDKKYDKSYEQDYDKKEQEFGWDTDWSAIMNKKGIGGIKENNYEHKEAKKYDYKEMKKCDCKDTKKYEDKCPKQYESKEYKKNEKAKMYVNNMYEDKEACNMVMCVPMMQGKMEESKPITIGDKMPKMTVKTTMGMKTLPDDYLGKWLVLFSHPGDFTPVCTTEFVSFAKNYDNFKQLETELLGLSVDQVQPHIKWTQWIEEKLCTPIPFPIIADPMGTVAKKLGMIHSTKSTQTVRAVFIIDPTGTIRMILHYPAEVGRNIEEIIRAVAALQVADKHNVAMPANWPGNELIGAQVIIPPAMTEEDAKKNEKSYCNYDWWFCYKNLE